MLSIPKRPVIDYIEAFKTFAPWANRPFKTHQHGLHVLINDGSYTYQVSHFEDILSDYVRFFESDPALIYTEFPAGLWQVFLQEQIHATPDDLTIDLYSAWQEFWGSQSETFDDNAHYEFSKASSYRQFNQLVEAFSHEPDQLISIASHLDEPTFLPVIAMAIKRQYPHEEDFFGMCVTMMTERFANQFGNGVIFVKVDAVDGDKTHTYSYFIYSVDENFF